MAWLKKERLKKKEEKEENWGIQAFDQNDSYFNKKNCCFYLQPEQQMKLLI